MTLQATPENLQGKPNISFRKDDFDSAIWKYGYDIKIDKAVICPCQGVDGNHLFGCQNCLGTGFFYINPIETIGLITGINKDTKYKEWSRELVGTISLSIRDNETNIQEKPAFFDRVTLIKKREGQATPFSVHSETLTIRDNGNGGKFIFLTYKPHEVIDIFYFKGQNEKHGRITANYSINENNEYVIDFSSLPVDLTNGVVTVRYKHYVQYNVVDMPHLIRFSSKKGQGGRLETQTLPIQAVCRLVHIVQAERANYDGTGIQDNSYLT
jgi:hypothetical protein